MAGTRRVPDSAGCKIIPGNAKIGTKSRLLMSYITQKVTAVLTEFRDLSLPLLGAQPFPNSYQETLRCCLCFCSTLLSCCFSLGPMGLTSSGLSPFPTPHWPKCPQALIPKPPPRVLLMENPPHLLQVTDWDEAWQSTPSTAFHTKNVDGSTALITDQSSLLGWWWFWLTVI